jgi:hypothetical protein
MKAKMAFKTTGYPLLKELSTRLVDTAFTLSYYFEPGLRCRAGYAGQKTLPGWKMPVKKPGQLLGH